MAAGSPAGERWLKECGCARLEKAEREGATGAARGAIERFALGRQKRWGCAAAGHPRPAALAPDRAAIAAQFGRALNAPPCEGCPFEAAYAGDQHAEELFDGLALTETGMTWLDAIGRQVTAADRDGVLVILRARGAMRALERREEEAARAKREGAEAGE